MTKLKHGTDPEVFSVIKINDDFQVISPALLEKFSGLKYIKQDGEEKHPVYIETEDYSWMMDGAAWELTVKKPQYNPMDLLNIIRTSMGHLEEFLSKFKFCGADLYLYTKPTVNIDPSLYIPYLAENKIAQGFMFGCDKDYDADDESYECKTLDVAKFLFRFGGGHLHTSGSEYFEQFPKPAIKFFTCTVGNFCIKNSPYLELEKQRGEIYGRPCRYRPQHYPNGDIGVEYRTPSNSWISMDTSKVEELFYWVNRAVEFLENRRVDILDNYFEMSKEAIITANKDLADDILYQIK
jgi:hypothetical protein